MEEKFKVLVIDDASFMVKAVTDLLEMDPDIEVVGFARNGLEGLEKIKELRPDVVTLDIDMPIMDGIRAIRHIMIEAPLPIVVLSSLFADGTITFEALRLGVVDFVPKPSGAISQDISRAKKKMIDRIKIATSINMENIRRVRLAKWDVKEGLIDRYGFKTLDYLIAIGTTLTGPNTAIRLFSELSPTLPAAAVFVKEISSKILPSFVKKFDEHVPWKIEMAQDGIVMEQGTCYISSNENAVRVKMNAEGEGYLSVEGREEMPLDILFESAADVFKQNTIGLLLTGIGDDGGNGFLKIKEKSGVTIAQSTDTCVYPNLTHNVIERMAVDSVVDERELSQAIESVIK